MKGSYITPSITIFHKDGTIDLEAMKRHFDFLIEGGVDGILILGSIGEFFAISMEEKKKLIKCAAEHINGRVRLIAGTTSMMKDEMIELSKFAHQAGVDGCIILPPFYFPMSAQRVEHYFDEIADELSDQKLLLYNFPDRTGYGIPAQVVLNLVRRHPNIVGYKDTQAGVSHTIELVKLVKSEFPDFEIFAGFDDNYVHNLLVGGNGCIAGLSNLAPGLCHAWVEACEKEDLEKMQEIQRTIDGLMEIYNVGTPFIPYIKAAVNAVGRNISETCTFPLTSANDAEKEKIAGILKKYGVLV